MVRNLPGTPYLRASVGAWNDEDDLDRLWRRRREPRRIRPRRDSQPLLTPPRSDE